MKRCTAPALAGILILISTAAFGDCVDGVRAATAGEQAFHDRMFAALREALPAAPPHWEARLPEAKPARLSLCNDAKQGAFSIAAQAKYTYKPPKEEADRIQAEMRALQKQVQDLEAIPPDVEAQRKELLARYSEATRAARQAEKDKDKELASRKYAEREGYNRQSNELRQRHLDKVRPQVDPLKEKLRALHYGPQDFTMRIAVNERYPNSLEKGRGVELRIGTVPAPASPGLKAQGVRVVVDGPAPRSEELLAAVDKAKLQSLLR